MGGIIEDFEQSVTLNSNSCSLNVLILVVLDRLTGDFI